MWSQIRGGKTRYFERYEDTMSGKIKTVSVTLDGKDTPQKRKLASRELEKIILKAQSDAGVGDITLEGLLRLYIDYQKQTTKLSTWKRNEYTLEVAIKALGPDTLVSNLTAGYIKSKLLTTTQNPTTLNEKIRRIKAMLRWGFLNDFIESTAVIEKLTRFKDDRSKEVKAEDKYMEPEQLSAVLAYMESTQEEWYLLTKFLVLSGLRIGEAIALEKKDIHDGVISINKTFDNNHREVTTPKTPASNRDVYIQEELGLVLAEIRRFYLNRDILLGVRSKLLFSGKSGDHIYYQSYCKYLREVTERVLGSRRTPHSLRHTHASLLLAEGMTIDEISRRLGHENSKITREIYLHIIERIKERDRERISKVKLLS